MKSDLFTKIVLSVIAICLVIIAVKEINIIPKAMANSNDNLNSKNSINYGLVPLNPDGSVNVKLNSSDVLKVYVEEVDQYAFTYCTVPVKIK